MEIHQERCNYCNIPGHWARECRKKQQQGNNSQSLAMQSSVEQKKSQTRQDNSRNCDEAQLFVAEKILQSLKEDDAWYADSGATEHVFSTRLV